MMSKKAFLKKDQRIRNISGNNYLSDAIQTWHQLCPSGKTQNDTHLSTFCTLPKHTAVDIHVINITRTIFWKRPGKYELMFLHYTVNKIRKSKRK